MSGETSCGACGGTGYIITPKMGYDHKGEPITYQEMTTCSACSGNGKVNT